VIQRHQARSLHYDFRLEHGGVYKSWALPKGLPEDIGVCRLAIQTADHDLAFGDFEGTIPDDEYGAGSIKVWDRGDYLEETLSDAVIAVVLRGTVISGRYTLVQFLRGGDGAWLVFKGSR
jgi:DNA ligase D-like protein (predicted 3'-phosphoesterase)